MRYPSDRGFTLLELIVVLLVVGLAASVVMMTTARTQEKTMLDQEARKLHRVLGYARELSLIQRAPFVFVSDEETGRFWIEKNGSPYGDVLVLHKNLMIRGDAIVFLPKGNSTGGSVAITDKKKRGYVIKVDPATGISEIFRLQPA
jgi:prepilin-type N-terminal cleavage/methylation domain-containing protein